MLAVKDTTPIVYINPQQIEARPGDSGQFKCFAVGDPRDPPPRISWRLQGGAPLPHDVEEGPDGILRFPNLQPHHAGSYECVATTDYGRGSATAPVRIKRKYCQVFDIT